MLKIEHIVKQFGKVKALDDVSIRIDRGEFFGMLGPNGAGKTTLMNIIVGYVKADSGSVSFEDKLLSTAENGTRLNFGYVPQEISLYPELSALQNLKIFGSLYGLKKNVMLKSIDEVLELVKLNDRKKDAVKNFSGGMKRRLNLAASILHKPKLLLCDEPTVGIDPQSRNAIFEMLQYLAEQNITIIYTTHHMEEAERLCSRLVIIDYGKIIAEGSLSEMVNMLDKKETIKIKKHSELKSKIKTLESMGRLIEFDLEYELIPDVKFNKMSQLFYSLEELNIPQEFIELSRSTLEDVFLNLTGRSLRD
ncbi:MAG: ABC transporter ATP-binding protein [Ignavibacteriae bacterium HGW-Ignavibacteriae-2]|jgi:ABC-2 type transport system ATP-binding protein|nr:MAG: ABC transporter ATP-binding protein [Ignavibacteriae bacterium HGW-Ignavibacteriae-2]